jgi:Fe-Mn family superoxide dismutase
MFEAKKYEHLLGTDGFSDVLLSNHFTLYEGYVKNTNLLASRLAELRTKGEVAAPEYAEMKRRFGWEWNGVRLHELYFGNLSKETATPAAASPLLDKIAASFGSFEVWEKDFRATGAMRGIGWVILAHDRTSGDVYNVWINEHDGGHLAGATPLLVMDVFEHAFVLDYGLKRADYIDAFFRHIDWTSVEGRAL